MYERLALTKDETAEEAAREYKWEQVFDNSCFSA